jgi:hypothetical protein
MPVPRDVKLWLGFNIVFLSCGILYILKEIYCLVFRGYVIGTHLQIVSVGIISGVSYGCFYAIGLVAFVFILDLVADSFAGNVSHSFFEKKMKKLGVFGKGAGLRIIVFAGSAFFLLGIGGFLLFIPK